MFAAQQITRRRKRELRDSLTSPRDGLGAPCPYACRCRRCRCRCWVRASSLDHPCSSANTGQSSPRALFYQELRAYAAFVSAENPSESLKSSVRLNINSLSRLSITAFGVYEKCRPLIFSYRDPTYTSLITFPCKSPSADAKSSVSSKQPWPRARYMFKHQRYQRKLQL